MTIRTTVLASLRRARLDQGLTLAQLAERAGVDIGTVSRLLGGRTFSMETADRVAGALGVTWNAGSTCRICRSPEGDDGRQQTEEGARMERTAFRVDVDLLEQADQIVERVERQHPDRILRTSRAAILRAALRRGLAELAREQSDEHPPLRAA